MMRPGNKYACSLVHTGKPTYTTISYKIQEYRGMLVYSQKICLSCHILSNESNRHLMVKSLTEDDMTEYIRENMSRTQILYSLQNIWTCASVCILNAGQPVCIVGFIVT